MTAGTRGAVVTVGPRATKAARPHSYQADPETPGTCRCRLIKGHRLHNAEALAAAAAAAQDQQAEHLRRLGERED